MGALTGVYYSAYARERIRAAQSVCDRHVTSAWTGCCVACGRPGPCPDQLEAVGPGACHRMTGHRRGRGTVPAAHRPSRGTRGVSAWRDRP